MPVFKGRTDVAKETTSCPRMIAVVFLTAVSLTFARDDGESRTAQLYAVRAASVEKCGLSKVGRIVGGVSALPGEFPWAVSILLNGKHYCGGTLIFKHWVITAAHCIHRHGKDSWKVRVGEYKLDERTKSEKEIAINKIILHPNFVLARYINDLALLRLSEDVIWDDSKQPICLPEIQNDTYVGKDVVVAGWGWLEEANKGGMRSNTLQKLTLKIVERRECQGWYHKAGKFVTINSNHMCAGYKEGKRDSCQGDSGGPLMLKTGHQHQLIGVVSAGIGCARPLLPGLYTKVASFLPWIHENTAD